MPVSEVHIAPLAEPTAAEWRSLPDKLSRERKWYADAERFKSDFGIVSALDDGRLVKVPENPFARPIRRFYMAPRLGTYAVLAPHAVAALLEFGERWQTNLAKNGVDAQRLRLPLTSMTRTIHYQDMLVEEGRLAVEDSTHTAGGAFDVDGSGYTLMTDEGFVPILTPDRHASRSESGRYYAGFRERHGDYDSRVTVAAFEVAQVMHEGGGINLVPEFVGTANACLHIAVSPPQNG